MITNLGMKIAVNRWGNTVPTYTPATAFKVGINQATTTVADADLTFPIPINSTEAVDTCDVTTNWSATTDGTIATSNTAFKQGIYSLTLIKAATTQANVTWYNQAEPSLDFTSKTLFGWIYIKDAATLAKLDPTSAVEIRYGNDYNTNYYKKVYALASLAVGWNMIYFTTATGTQVGTVTLASCDSLGVKLTFTGTSMTLAAGDILIDDYKLASTGDYTKTMEAGYPAVNENTYEITEKCYLNSAEANGFNITGLGTFNTDATAKLDSTFKTTAISKSATDEIAWYVRKRLTRR